MVHDGSEWASWYASVPESAPRNKALEEVLSMAFDRLERVKLVESLVDLGARQATLLAAEAGNTELQALDASLPLVTQHTLHRMLGMSGAAVQVPPRVRRPLRICRIRCICASSPLQRFYTFSCAIFRYYGVTGWVFTACVQVLCRCCTGV
jgi:hypothetical protein